MFISLTQGMRAEVNDADTYLGEYKWHAVKIRHSFYAATSIRNKRFYMHHIIMGLPLKGFVVDHVDGNGLNNRRENLRFVSNRENISNNYKRRTGKTFSRFAGVTRKKCRRFKWKKDGCEHWTACISINRKTKFLGVFRSENEAAKAYRNAAISLGR